MTKHYKGLKKVLASFPVEVVDVRQKHHTVFTLQAANGVIFTVSASCTPKDADTALKAFSKDVKFKLAEALSKG